jgi:hypothetical protein
MDERYQFVKTLITSGQITEFRQLFKHIPKQVVADDHRTSPKHLTRIMGKPDEITLREFYEFGESFGVGMDVIYNLAKQQLLAKKEAPRTKHKSINHT